MFYGRMEEHKIYKPVEKDDGFGYKYWDYVKAGSALIYIVLQDRSDYKSNDLNLTSSTLVGYTDCGKIGKHWMIDGKYVVENVIPHRRQWILYLKEVEDG